MPFNLIMPRKAFATVQVICDEYEEKFQEKVSTAKVVNVLVCGDLIRRGRIPEDFIKKQYGSDDPIEEGFTKKARELSSGIGREVKLQKEADIVKMTRTFSDVHKQWNKMPEKSKQYWKKKAKEYEALIPDAKLILARANGDNNKPGLVREDVSPRLMENGEGSK